MKVTNINYTDTLCTLSADEQRVAQMLGDAWNQYLQLSTEHLCERDEFCRAIHACQRIILARPAIRGLAEKGQGYKK
ncbi:hypothetical protein [Yersinia enterocolitica]|uniref:hypothetical protein n=1 Tax=Yersinia enterocolitica TaxID=630 RepID=UPI001C8E1751|nr:hypothetical protein [Yersinia enterocolitica]ELI8013272.1 hypothetical protein [Yersinia enterocolitica]MBX9481549.1 hypothetical protein [Yersinia enterocolitica]HEN3262871.1 hypothetical protein [Yersinia enterocolitica]HEN3388104.1 hypothetical protein [Yersinia enterocolitica]HEN3419273.1 hypothetical protein [Yersinia enterocolitica]